MTIHSVADRQAYLNLLPTLREGDCVQIGSFSVIAANAAELFEAAAELESRGAELISLGEALDTRSESGKLFFALCRSLRVLDGSKPPRRREGVERAKEEGRYR